MTNHTRNPNIAVAIAKAGMTCIEVAKAAGISRCHLSRIMRLRSIPTVYTAQRLARALDTTVEALWPIGKPPRPES